MKKLLIAFTLISAQIFSGCGNDAVNDIPPPENKFDLSNAKDGVYSVESSRDDKLGYSKLTLTIEDHKITAAEFHGVDLFGNVKDAEYGSMLGKDSADYRKAQVAVKAIEIYPKQLVETQNLKKVDAISGATISYNQFVEATENAVEEASR